jgi:hypothetical protein
MEIAVVFVDLVDVIALISRHYTRTYYLIPTTIQKSLYMNKLIYD